MGLRDRLRAAAESKAKAAAGDRLLAADQAGVATLKAKRRPRPAIDWAGRIAASGVLAQWEGETGTGDAAPSTARSLLNCDGHAFLTWAVTNLETDRD